MLTIIFNMWRFKQASSGSEGAVKLPSGGRDCAARSVGAASKNVIDLMPVFLGRSRGEGE